MAPQRHRFSQRFLTILILITCIAIVLLSRMDGAGETSSNEVAPAPSQQYTP